MNENERTSHGTGHEPDSEPNRDGEEGVTGHAQEDLNEGKEIGLEGYELIARSGRAIRQHAERILGVTDDALSQTPEAQRKRASRKNAKKAGKKELSVGQVPEAVVGPFQQLAECARSTGPDQVSLLTADIAALVTLIKEGKLGVVAGRNETATAGSDSAMAELEIAKATIREMGDEMVRLRGMHQGHQDARQVEIDQGRDQLEKANAEIETLSKDKVKLEQEAARSKPKLEKLAELEKGLNAAASIRGSSGALGFLARGAFYVAVQAAKWASTAPGRKAVPASVAVKPAQVLGASKPAARPAASFKPNASVLDGRNHVPSPARSPRP